MSLPGILEVITAILYGEENDEALKLKILHAISEDKKI